MRCAECAFYGRILLMIFIRICAGALCFVPSCVLCAGTFAPDLRSHQQHGCWLCGARFVVIRTYTRQFRCALLFLVAQYTKYTRGDVHVFVPPCVPLLKCVCRVRTLHVNFAPGICCASFSPEHASLRWHIRAYGRIANYNDDGDGGGGGYYCSCCYTILVLAQPLQSVRCCWRYGGIVVQAPHMHGLLVGLLCGYIGTVKWSKMVIRRS